MLGVPQARSKSPTLRQFLEEYHRKRLSRIHSEDKFGSWGPLELDLRKTSSSSSLVDQLKQKMEKMKKILVSKQFHSMQGQMLLYFTEVTGLLDSIFEKMRHYEDIIGQQKLGSRHKIDDGGSPKLSKKSSRMNLEIRRSTRALNTQEQAPVPNIKLPLAMSSKQTTDRSPENPLSPRSPRDYFQLVQKYKEPQSERFQIREKLQRFSNIEKADGVVETPIKKRNTDLTNTFKTIEANELERANMLAKYREEALRLGNPDYFRNAQNRSKLNRAGRQ